MLISLKLEEVSDGWGHRRICSLHEKKTKEPLTTSKEPDRSLGFSPPQISLKDRDRHLCGVVPLLRFHQPSLLGNSLTIHGAWAPLAVLSGYQYWAMSIVSTHQPPMAQMWETAGRQILNVTPRPLQGWENWWCAMLAAPTATQASWSPTLQVIS